MAVAQITNGAVTVMQTEQRIIVEESYPPPSTWSTGLCSCCDDCGICACGFFCFPCLFASVGSRVHAPVGCFKSCCGCCNLPCLCLGAFCCGVGGGVGPRNRNIIRRKYNLPGSIGGDAAAWRYCAPCALCQEARELKKRGVMGDKQCYGPNETDYLFFKGMSCLPCFVAYDWSWQQKLEKYGQSRTVQVPVTNATTIVIKQ